MKKYFNSSNNDGTNIRLFIFVIVILAIIYHYIIYKNTIKKKEITYEEFEKDKNDKNIEIVTVYDKKYLVYKDKKDAKLNKYLYLDDTFTTKFDYRTVDFKIRHRESFNILAFFNIIAQIIFYFLIFLLLINILHQFKKSVGTGNGDEINQNMIRDAIQAKINNSTTLDNVGGLFEVKKEVIEFAEIILNPAKYLKIGAKIPTGLLMTGPPGTGKTMLAKAMAKEYDTPFFYVSGSDFSKPIVGMGSIFVKSIFTTARKFKPCIIFIDEIDSIGSKRSSDNSSSHLEEKNAILNSLLTEMDGFQENNKGVIIMGATNRLDILDPALLRPGRFDRIVDFKIPTLDERKHIINIYVDKVKVNKKEKKKLIEYIIDETSGFTGAEVYNVINEACIHTAKNNGEFISYQNIVESIDYVLYGYSKPISILSKKELQIVAYHEAGHTLISLVCKDIIDAVKLTIIPRSKGMLGFTKLKAEENKNLHSKKELICKMLLGMGGRAAEEYKFGNYDITTGASSDIDRINSIAKQYVVCYGMDEEIGLLQKSPRDINTFILERIQKLINNLYKVCLYMMNEYSDLLEALTNSVLKKKTIIIEEEKFKYKVIPDIEKYIRKVLKDN